MTTIGIILVSTRPGRRGEPVATWVHDIASRRSDAVFELVDLRDQALPHLDEPMPAMTGSYQRPHTRTWSSTIAAYDGFVFVTPEYNQGMPGMLKTALDFLFAEWRGKAAAIVSYGVAGGAVSAGQLRQLCGVLGIADVPTGVNLTLADDFTDYTAFTPRQPAGVLLAKALDEVVAWSNALAPLREAPAEDREAASA
ncbi:NAD(P)H-dependent oxidoreductase [Nocardioides sp. CER19]|uniref:NADPH-dependent FMN reductase n=1 Tax=Nocardioides sp. CER19 TaxID=3038538 RepID=UPI00244D7704|nr:NAD(P)H-dependent oxidoreductase [Nocardioides sp. CER19]MDH2416265.1 NAD(P)H-dependent oxidoreductase [Nocardioides sp. CER19]